ncbi:peptide chain release factor 2 [bacterium]|jgi:peptide chain release factor 2|nr:peptide chain release factor 2 [bacterium]
MLIDELREQIKSIEPDIKTIKTFWTQSENAKKYESLKKETEQETFWQHKQRTEILKKLQGIRELKKQYETLTKSFEEILEMVELFKDDEEELNKLKIEISSLEKSVSYFKVNVLLDDPNDGKACFLSINAGAGGTESQDWTSMLMRMYLRFCEREKLNSKIVDIISGEEAGVKSVTLYIKGTNAFGLLKGERGIHRLVRISPFDSNKRRHTSFSGVMVMPEAEEVAIEIDPKDLRIDTYRASGAGGQHVNKTDSAVRITHNPTGIVVQCQNERSQLQNKETSMKMLKAKLVQKQQEEQDAKRAKIEKKKIEWGSQIRSYVLHPYKMVKDHRTNIESPQPDVVLDGDLMKFIESNLLLESKK